MAAFARFVRSSVLASLPFLAAVTLVAVVVASAISVGATFSSREEYRRQATVVEGILERQQAGEDRQQGAEERERARLAETLAEVDRLTALRFEGHDTAARDGHEQLLGRIAELLGRPAGITVDPVAATVEGEAAP